MQVANMYPKSFLAPTSVLYGIWYGTIQYELYNWYIKM